MNHNQLPVEVIQVPIKEEDADEGSGSVNDAKMLALHTQLPREIQAQNLGTRSNQQKRGRFGGFFNSKKDLHHSENNVQDSSEIHQRLEKTLFFKPRLRKEK